MGRGEGFGTAGDRVAAWWDLAVEVLCCTPGHTAVVVDFVGTLEGPDDLEKREEERCNHAWRAAEKEMSMMDGCRRQSIDRH